MVMGHSSRLERPEGPAPLGLLGDRASALAGLGDALLSAVTADDVRELLHICPPRIARALLAPVGLRDVRKFSPVAAKAVLRGLRHGDSRRRGALRSIISSGALHDFGNPDGLDAADCADVLVPAKAESVLSRAPRLRSRLRSESPASIVRWCLACVIEEDRPLAPVALGLLAADSAELGDQAARVASAWETLRADHPDLPAHPMGAAELRALARRTAECPASPAEENETMTTSDTPPATVEAEVEAFRPPTLEDLAVELDLLRERFPRAAEAAGRIADELRVGRRPTVDDVALMEDAIAGFDDVRAQIEAVLPSAAPAGDLPMMTTAVDTALSSAREAEGREARIRALSGIEGPENVADLVREVREAAGETGEDEGLDLLAQLIETAADTDRAHLAPELAERARERLPDRWQTLVYLALMRRLTFSIAPAEVSVETAGRAAGADASQSTSSDGAGRDPEENDPDDLGNGGAQEPGPGPEGESGPEGKPGPASGTGPAPSTDAVQEPEAASPSASAEDDDLADLDAMLAETFSHGPVEASSAADTSSSSPETLTAAPPASTMRHGVPGGGTPAADRPPKKGELIPVAEAAEPEEEEGAPPEAPAVLTTRIEEAESAALLAGRFGIAGRLRTSVGRPETEERARKCAALAAEMATFAGPLSAEFAAASQGLSAKTLADDPAGGLLAWAAAIRAGLVHPTPESTRLLEDLNVVVSGRPDLEACGDAFIRAARGGAYLGSGLVGRIRGSAKAANDRRAAVNEASRLLDQEPHRKIRYQFATEVWKALVQGDGTVGKLLAIASRDDAQMVDHAVKEITRLRSSDAINRTIDEYSGRLTGRRKNKKIIARAHTELVKKVENALDTVGRWAAAVKETGTGPVADPQAWRLGPLGQLQEVVGERREAIDAALDAIACPPDARPAPEGRPGPVPLLSAAAVAARGLVDQALDLLDGDPPKVPEPPVAHVVNRHLLLADEIGLHPSTLEPLSPPDPEALIPVALAETEDWTAAFDARARRLDHEGTRRVVEVLQRGGSENAARLGKRRDELVTAARVARDARVEEIRDRIAVWLRDGVLNEDQARAAEETLRSLTDGRRIDFDHVERALDVLFASLSADREAAIERERTRLARRAEVDRLIGDADASRVARLIDRGDLTTAREFLAQAEAGNSLPEASGDVAHLERFYPAFPRAFADIAVRAGSRARKQETNEGLTELMDALQGGREVADEDLATLLSGVGVRIPELRNARREESREGLRQWKACGLGSKTAGNLRTGITAILKMIGLEGEQHDGPREQHRIWIDLEGVRRVGETPLPAFGSRMSPSGDRLRLVLVWRRPGPQQLIELLKGQPDDQTILVFYFGVLSAEERQQLAVAARRRPSPVTAVLDDAAIGYLACMPEADWSAAVALTAPFTATNPYAPVGDVPDEMFYGRDDQLRDVTGRPRCSFVYGGRQLGKSALLRKAERDIRRTDPNRTVILENIQTVGKVAPPESLWPKLADKLARARVIPAGAVKRDQVREAVRDWSRDRSRQVLVLLDEADHFLNQDAEDGRFENVTALRDLMDETDDRFKVIFAGLHQTARFQSLPNQPLAHLGTPVAVGPLEPQNAFDLLVRPLAALGFRFPETLAARVIAEANNAPALVQLFAEELLTRLRRNSVTARTFPYEITRDDVEAVWRDKSLVRGFRDRFEWTLNLDKRYKVIAYTVALHALAAGADETLSVSELWEQCERGWAPGFEGCTSDGFRGLLDECVNLGVLGLSGDRYRLRTPHILNLLGGIDDVQKVLDNAGEFELPDAFDAHSYRGVYRDGPERAPLSSAQLARITRPHDLVHVVAGSRALHADRVYLTLKAQETERTDLRVHRIGAGERTFEGACTQADRHDGHTVIVVDVPDGRSRQYFEQRIEEARAAVAERARGTLSVVLVAGSSLAPAWIATAELDGVELVELRRFDRPAVRQWMSEDSQQGFPDEAGQEALLQCTGGWPILIGQVVQRLAEHGGHRDQALDHCVERLHRHPAEFVRSTGVLADRCLTSAWRVLVAENAPDALEDLATLLDMHGEQPSPDLAAPALGEAGYASTVDLIEALRVLGALVPAEGRLACEPVLADATRRMGAF